VTKGNAAIERIAVAKNINFFIRGYMVKN